MAGIERHVVLIPTQDRPQFLYMAVKSVFDNMRSFNRNNVRILVLDDSRKKESSKENLERLRKAASEAKFDFDKHVIYYGREEQEAFLEHLAQEAGEGGHEKLLNAIPQQKSFGRARNFLTLLGVFHGGPNAAYHWLDDDTTLQAMERKLVIRDANTKPLREEETGYGTPLGKELFAVKAKPLQYDFFAVVEGALSKTGHAVGMAVGVRDTLPGSMSILLGLDFKHALQRMASKAQEGLAGEAESEARKMIEWLKVMRSGRAPISRHTTFPRGRYSVGGFNRSLLYAPFTKVPFALNTSDEDELQVRMLEENKEHALEKHDAPAFHWSGSREKAFPLHFKTFDETLKEVKKLKNEGKLAGVKSASTLLQELEAYAELQVEKTLSRDYGGEEKLDSKALEEWPSLIEAAERMREARNSSS